MPDFLSFLKEDKPTGRKSSLESALSGSRGSAYNTDLGGDFYATKSNADLAHNTVMIVYRASTYISDFVTMIPWEIKSKVTGEVVATNKDPDGHPLAVAITQQRRKSKQPFFALWSKALSLAGENYIEPIKEKNVLTGREGSRYVALDWLQPAMVDPYTVYGILSGFYYSGHGRSEFFQPHELVYDHLFNAIDENRGWSPVLTAMTEVNLDRDSKRAFQAWFRNGMLPPVIFGPSKEDVGLGNGIDEALDKLRDQLKEKHRGAGNAFRSMVVNWPIDVTTVNQPDINRNVDILQYWKNEVAIAFGLPPVVLGDASATPFKDAPEILAAAYNNAIAPQLIRMEQSVNVELMPFFDNSGEFILEFDKKKYEKLGENEQENLDLQAKKYETGGITLQTYRTLIGATTDDEDEAWETLPAMIKVEGIAAPVPLTELENISRSAMRREDVIAKWNAGLISLNNALIQLGDEPIDNGDLYNVPGGVIQVTAEGLGQIQAKPSYVTYGSPQVPIQQAEVLAIGAGQQSPSTPPVQTNPESEAPVAITQQEGTGEIPDTEVKDALPTPMPGMKSAYIGLDLSDNETVKQLQVQAQEMFPDMEAADPSSFHLTLVHMTDMEAGSVLNSIIEEIVPRPVELTPQALDIMGQDNAVVVKVELTPELKRLQYDCSSQAEYKQAAISEYHQPENFIPHITLGYIDESEEPTIFYSGPAIAANDIIVSVKEGDEYKQVGRVKQVSSRKALTELSQWGRFHKKAVAGKHLLDRTFDFNHVRPSVETFIKAQLDLGIEWKTVLGQATVMHRVKAIDTTKTNYMQAVAAMIGDARAGRIAKTRFRENYRNLNKNTISRAYTDGLEDAGVFEETQSEETKEAIRQLKLEPTPFVKDFTDKLYSEEGITDAEAAGKPLAWFNGSISSIYSQGLIAGNENGMYEFFGEPGADPCVDCTRLNVLPDRHRLKAWDRRNLNMAEGAFVGQNTKCGGHKCKHGQRRATGRAQGKF